VTSLVVNDNGFIALRVLSERPLEAISQFGSRPDRRDGFAIDFSGPVSVANDTGPDFHNSRFANVGSAFRLHCHWLLHRLDIRARRLGSSGLTHVKPLNALINGDFPGMVNA
jgi:hypothetical protein